MLNDLAVTDDHKMLLNSMNSCADKIINLVNSLRNQIRNIGSDEKTKISIKSIIDDIYVILHNELTKNKINLNIDIKQDITLLGNSTKLSQVVTNIVMNAIQAYEGKEGEIKLSIYKSDKNEAIIRVEDHAGGIPESVRPYVFKNILTTKGVSGTGFGLYLAYSVIKGAFGGEILFDTKTGEGTVFYIVIPMDV
jgi:signal transduction histidine kinase